MTRCLIASLALLACLFPAAAEPMELLVQTYPPGASMRDQFGNELGRSGKPVTLDWSRAKGTLQLELSLDNHKPVVRSLSYREISQGVYPEDGALQLPADGLVTRLSDFIKYKTSAFVTTILLGVSVLGAVALKLKNSKESAPKAQKLGRYTLLTKVGQGATAEVFKAISEEDPGSLPVAIKLMKDSETLDGQSKERFQQEIKVSLSLDHPNLVKVYDWGESDDGRLYLATEFLDGVTLRELMSAQPVDVARICEILQSLGGALEYLHRQGLVHRDVKPDNVFLTKKSNIKLMDLGITKGDDTAPLTRAGTAMGTPHYMAPEQARGVAVPASDQYSVGVMTFELLTGTRPYKGLDGLEILQKHLNSPIPCVSEYKDLGPLVDDVVRQAMAKNSESRFSDIGSCVNALVRALSQEGDMGTDTVAS